MKQLTRVAVGHADPRPGTGGTRPREPAAGGSQKRGLTDVGLFRPHHERPGDRNLNVADGDVNHVGRRHRPPPRVVMDARRGKLVGEAAHEKRNQDSLRLASR